MKNIRSLTEQQPQYMQQETAPGVLKGIVVDVRDPWQLGRVRVACYGTNGDYPDLDVSTLLWAEPAHKGRGFAPLELFDRVMLTFDTGNKYAPMFLGTWRAMPMGDGTLPQNKRIGNENRMECWHHHDLYPETQMPCSSANGNSIWINDIYMDEKNFASSINLQDVSGKFFKIKTFKLDAKVWSPVIRVPKGEGALYKYDPGDNEAMRYGYEHVDQMDSEAGVIEFGHQRLKQHMFTAKEDFTLDQKTQKAEDDGDVTAEERWQAGKLRMSRVDQASMVTMGGAMMLTAPSFIFLNNFLAPPTRWDDEDEEEQESSGSEQATVVVE